MDKWLMTVAITYRGRTTRSGGTVDRPIEEAAEAVRRSGWTEFAPLCFKTRIGATEAIAVYHRVREAT